MPETRYCHNCGEACGWEDRFCTSCRAELRPTVSRPSGGMRSGSSVPDPRDALASMQTELGLPTGSLLADRYKILKELGAGGMGRVYLAEDQKLAIPVAVKVLRDILKQDPGSVKRLVAEAKASILLSHPNIVRLHNFEDGETAKFLVMEYVEGETLAHKIAREGKISEEDARRIGAEVCKGLELAHQKKVIHRDMKPGNVLLGKDGSVKIADFGIARLCRDSMSRLTSQQDSGTLLYMAPEQLDGESGEASDIYSFGVMLYEMLAGDPPFLSGEITAQIRYKAPKEIAGLSPAMSRIVMKCLEKKPENRFASVKELREELDGTAGQRRALQAETGPRAEMFRNSGARAFNEGNYAEAVTLWEQALALKPGDPDLTASLKRAREAQANAGKTGVTQPGVGGSGTAPIPPSEPDRQQRIDALKTKGNDSYNAGRFGEAIAAWQEALQLNPADTSLNEMLAAARKQVDLVIQEAERKKAAQALQQWTEDVMARVNGLMQKGTYAEAANLLRQALQRVPGHAQITEQLARVRQLMASPVVPGGETPIVLPKKPAKSRKMLWITVGIIAAVFLVAAFFVAVINEMGPGSSGLGGKPGTNETGTRSSDLTGSWIYTLIAPGVRINGQVMISGSDEQLYLRSSATYMWPGPDGMLHQVTEAINYEGSFNGQSLFMECVGGAVQMAGYPPTAPQGVGTEITLVVSPDRRSMQGQVPLGPAVGSLSMRKQ
jgi:serine/threonine protein kinase